MPEHPPGSTRDRSATERSINLAPDALELQRIAEARRNERQRIAERLIERLAPLVRLRDRGFIPRLSDVLTNLEKNRSVSGDAISELNDIASGLEMMMETDIRRAIGITVGDWHTAEETVRQQRKRPREQEDD